MAKTTEKKDPPLMGESYRTILLGMVDGYKKRSGVTSDQVLSRQVYGNDGLFIDRIRDGNFTVEKAIRLERWILRAEAMLSGKVPPGELPPLKKPGSKPAVTRPVLAKDQPKPKKAVAKAKPRPIKRGRGKRGAAA